MPLPVAIPVPHGEIGFAPEEGPVPQVREIIVQSGFLEIGGSRIPLWERWGGVEGLSALEPGVVYIVPPSVAAQIKHPWVVAPHEPTMDDRGRVIRCRGFVRIISP